MKSSAIKIFVAAGLWGVASISLMLCDDDSGGNKCTAADPTAIVLYTAGASVTLSGNLYALSGSSLRGKVDNLCKAEKPDGIECCNVKALISLSSEDQIANFPARYNTPTNLPVKDPTGTYTIADNWADLMDGSVDTSLYDAGLTEYSWTNLLTGSDASGQYLAASSCDGWTATDSSTNVAWGSAGQTDTHWITYSNAGYCQAGSVTRIICIAY